MNAEMNHLLEQMRTQLKTEAESDGEEAWGPESEPEDTDDGEPGEGGAENENNVSDAFDMYISDMVDDLMEKYELDEDGALDFVFSTADDLAAEGKLPEIPSEEDDAKGLAVWLGKAGSLGFERMVLDAALAASEGSED